MEAAERALAEEEAVQREALEELAREKADPQESEDRPLSPQEQEALLGRPLADGLTFEQYRAGTIGAGGAMRE